MHTFFCPQSPPHPQNRVLGASLHHHQVSDNLKMYLFLQNLRFTTGELEGLLRREGHGLERAVVLFDQHLDLALGGVHLGFAGG